MQALFSLSTPELGGWASGAKHRSGDVHRSVVPVHRLSPPVVRITWNGFRTKAM